MIKKSLKWLLMAFGLLILADEILPLAGPWHGSSAQWDGLGLAAIPAAMCAILAIAYVLMQAVLFIGVWRLGAGDVKKGRQILAARMAARNARGKIA